MMADEKMGIVFLLIAVALMFVASLYSFPTNVLVGGAAICFLVAGFKLMHDSRPREVVK